MAKHTDDCPASYLDPGICDCDAADDLPLNESLFRLDSRLRDVAQQQEAQP